MKQVKVWMEVCSLNNKAIFYDSTKSKKDPSCELGKKIFDLIWDKIGVCKVFRYGKLVKLKPNESRETIIQELWEYQKSLLPDVQGWYLQNFDRFIANAGELIDITFGGLTIQNFYNPTTRTITITDFGGEK